MIKALILALFILAPSLYPAASDPIQRAEQSIASADHEIALVFDTGMRQIARFEGGATSTTVTITYRWRNGTLTHNHPCTASACTLPSLSILDLATCAAGDVRECRVVSVSTGRFMVCRAWKVNRWPRFNVVLLRAQVQQLIDYKPWPVADVALRGYITGLSRQLGFGYECK
jgi:hypothetical protein